jgi:hypothetical protein
VGWGRVVVVVASDVEVVPGSVVIVVSPGAVVVVSTVVPVQAANRSASAMTERARRIMTSRLSAAADFELTDADSPGRGRPRP